MTDRNYNRVGTAGYSGSCRLAKGTAALSFGLSLIHIYRLDYDAGQRENVAWEHPELTEKMERRIQEILKSGRTREDVPERS